MMRGIPFLVAVLLLCACAGLSGCSTWGMSEEEKTARLNRKYQLEEEKHREKMRRRVMRARHADDRYEEWWDAVMGRGGY